MSKEINKKIEKEFDSNDLKKIHRIVCSRCKKSCLNFDLNCVIVTEVYKMSDELNMSLDEILEIYKSISNFSEKEIKVLFSFLNLCENH